MGFGSEVIKTVIFFCKVHVTKIFKLYNYKSSCSIGFSESFKFLLVEGYNFPSYWLIYWSPIMYRKQGIDKTALLLEIDSHNLIVGAFCRTGLWDRNEKSENFRNFQQNQKWEGKRSWGTPARCVWAVGKCQLWTQLNVNVEEYNSC